MSARESVRKLLAFESSKALPRYSTRHIRLSSEALHLAFVRMGGETRPWGVVYGYAGDDPTFLYVTDPRNRPKVEVMLAEFADFLLKYFRAEGFSFDSITKEDLPIGAPPQIWLPGPSHLDMLHYLSYTFWKPRRDDADRSSLAAVSRLCAWLFREFSTPGQQIVIDGSAALRDSYVFPIDDFGLTHVGAQLEWIGGNADYGSRLLKSRKQAQGSLGITMNPEVEIGLNQALAKIKNKKTAEVEVAKLNVEINQIIETELRKRWDAAVSSSALLAADSRKENAGVTTLVKDSLSRYVFDFQRIERQLNDPERGPAFTAHPETDHHGSAAASKYYQLEAAESKVLPTLIHDDSELLNENLANGKAIRASVLRVEVERNGKSKKIRWIAQTSAPEDIRIREGDSLSPLGSQGHVVKVESLSFVSEQEIQITFEWIGRKTLVLESMLKEKPEDSIWIGSTLVLVPVDTSSMSMRASQAVWDSRHGEGAWLTHSSSQSSPDVAVVDDVFQLEGNM